MRNHGMAARLMTMLVVLALALAPAIIVATHGPTALAAAEQTALHGHSHDVDGDLWQGHDATDHDHQHNALLTGKPDGDDIRRSRASLLIAITADGLPQDLPLRPPRA